MHGIPPFWIASSIGISMQLLVHRIAAGQFVVWYLKVFVLNVTVIDEAAIEITANKPIKRKLSFFFSMIHSLIG